MRCETPHCITAKLKRESRHAKRPCSSPWWEVILNKEAAPRSGQSRKAKVKSLVMMSTCRGSSQLMTSWGGSSLRATWPAPRDCLEIWWHRGYAKQGGWFSIPREVKKQRTMRQGGAWLTSMNVTGWGSREVYLGHAQAPMVAVQELKMNREQCDQVSHRLKGQGWKWLASPQLC